MNADLITDAEGHPTLTEDGRRTLQFLREHPHAPIFRNESGNHLRADDVAKVREFEREVQAAEVGWRPGGERPSWLASFVEGCFSEYPSIGDTAQSRMTFNICRPFREPT